MQNMNIFGKFLVVLGLFQESQWCWMWDTLSIESDKIHKKEKCFFLNIFWIEGLLTSYPFKEHGAQSWVGFLGMSFISLRHFSCFHGVTFMKQTFCTYASLLNAKEFFQKDHIWYVKPLLTSISIIIAAE